MGHGRLAIDYIEHQFTLTANDTTVDETVGGAMIGDHVILTGREALAGEIQCWIAAADTVTIRTNSNENGHECMLLVIRELDK